MLNVGCSCERTEPDSKFKDEAKWLRKTDQLLAEGPFGGYNFIVFRGVADGRHIVATHFFATHIIPVMKGQEHFAKCEELVKQKLELVVQEVKTYVYVTLCLCRLWSVRVLTFFIGDLSRVCAIRTKFGILHTDIQPGNILWDEDATKPTLIDWGRAREEKDKHVRHPSSSSRPVPSIVRRSPPSCYIVFFMLLEYPCG